MQKCKMPLSRKILVICERFICEVLAFKLSVLYCDISILDIVGIVETQLVAIQAKNMLLTAPFSTLCLEFLSRTLE